MHWTTGLARNVRQIITALSVGEVRTGGDASPFPCGLDPATVAGEGEGVSAQNQPIARVQESEEK